MKTILKTPTFILEASLKHDLKYDLHTLEFWQTWPTMAKPHARRVAQFNLSSDALGQLSDLLSEAHQPIINP